MTDAKIKMQVLSGSTTQCRSCGAVVRWGKTTAGKNMICEGTAQLDEDDCILSSQSHWAHCPDARDWRKKNTQEKP